MLAAGSRAHTISLSHHGSRCFSLRMSTRMPISGLHNCSETMLLCNLFRPEDEQEVSLACKIVSLSLLAITMQCCAYNLYT